MWWSIKFGISCFLRTVFHFLCYNSCFARMKAVCVNTGVHNLLYHEVQRGGPAGVVLWINTYASASALELPFWLLQLPMSCLYMASSKSRKQGERKASALVSVSISTLALSSEESPSLEAPTQASFSSSLIVQEWATDIPVSCMPGRIGKGQQVSSASTVGVGSTRKEERGVVGYWSGQHGHHRPHSISAPCKAGYTYKWQMTLILFWGS